MTTSSQVPSSWLEKRRRRRKKVIFTRSVITIIILVLFAMLLAAIGLLYTIQGGTILAVVAIIVPLVAWLFQPPFQTPPSQNAALAQTASLQASAIVASQQVPQNPDSIFHFVTRLVDEKDLYGREIERRTLVNRTRQKNSTSLVGPRRIGKSWLITYLRLVAPTQLGPNYRVVSMDATSKHFDTLAEFTAHILNLLKARVRDRQHALRVLDIAIDELDKERQKLQPRILIVLERAMQDLSRTGIIPVVCIDEFSGLFDQEERSRYRDRRKEFNLDFFRSLRVMCENPDINFVLVIASQDSLKKIVGQAGRASGFFNIFNQIIVRPFNLNEAEEFIEDKGNQALFTDVERDQMLKLGAPGWGISRRYWPIRLELIGELILSDKLSNTSQYRPDDPRYWKKFKRKLEEKYREVF